MFVFVPINYSCIFASYMCHWETSLTNHEDSHFVLHIFLFWCLKARSGLREPVHSSEEEKQGEIQIKVSHQQMLHNAHYREK